MEDIDVATWNLRAEGNGYILTSTLVQGLGAMVVFAQAGKSTFHENCVIPCQELKELSFGTVPNIFDDEFYLYINQDSQSITLAFGSDEDTASTLGNLGFSSNTIMKFKRSHEHVFSRTYFLSNLKIFADIIVTFEIIGMLAKVCRIRGSSFKMLPNPTNDQWGKRLGRKASWKTTSLITAFQSELKGIITADNLPESHPIGKIARGLDYILKSGCTDERDLRMAAREAIHDSIDESTQDKNDVMMVPSNLKGSRMPVYIG